MFTLPSFPPLPLQVRAIKQITVHEPPPLPLLSPLQVRAIKQITVHEPPNVLTIHLKRFEFGSFGSKISKKVGGTET